MKPLVPRRAANTDIDFAIDYYISLDAELANSFIDALEAAKEQICVFPGSGSPVLGHTLGIAGLRTWNLKRFPFLVCYIELSGYVDVWRVLHSSRDLSGQLHPDSDDA